MFAENVDTVASKVTLTTPRGVRTVIEADRSNLPGSGRMTTRRQPSARGRMPIRKRGMIHAGAAVHG